MGKKMGKNLLCSSLLFLGPPPPPRPPPPPHEWMEGQEKIDAENECCQNKQHSPWIGCTCDDWEIVVTIVVIFVVGVSVSMNSGGSFFFIGSTEEEWQAFLRYFKPWMPEI